MSETKTHANLDYQSRIKKAKKIELLVKNLAHLDFGNFLEIGCGSGYIASYFSELGFGSNASYAVDVADEREVRNFQFAKVESTTLPHENNQFDLVVSNHVIEHVGDEAAQSHHLSEIYRVLKPSGVFYFAVPNKWHIMEPHYKLPFLSWLSSSMASSYVKLFRKGDKYDCQLLSASTCRELLEKNHFSYRNVSVEAISIYASIEGGLLARVLSMLPKPLLKMLNPFMPTFIYLCEKR